MFLPRLLLATLLVIGTTVGAHSSEREGGYPRFPIEAIGEFSFTMASGDEADVYFPDVVGFQFPPVAFLQGALVDKQFYSEFGRQVARHGFIVFIPNHFQEVVPGEGPMLFIELKVITDVQTQAALENDDPSSPLFDRVDNSRLGLSGHSFGGAGALFAIEESCSPPFCNDGSFTRPAELGAAALFGANSAAGPFILDIDSSAVPTALIQGSRDGAAEPEDGLGTYDVLEPPRALIGLRGVNHFGITDVNNPPGANPDPIPPTVEQAIAIERTAGWAGVFLRAFLYDDSVAKSLVFESGGIPEGDVLILSEE